MKIITLKSGQQSIVDDDMYEYLSDFKWYFSTNKKYHNKSGYAVRRKHAATIRMHREIWERAYGEIPDGVLIDHITRNKLDNRLENLRLATKSQNMMNTKLRADSTTGYKGVFFVPSKTEYTLQDGTKKLSPRSKPYWAYIKVEEKRIGLGMYVTALEAAYIRDQFALALHGEHAYFNVIDK